MSKDITIASTTDTQEEVNLAAGIIPAKTEETPPPEVALEGEERTEVQSEAEGDKAKIEAEPETAQPQKTEADKDKGKGGFTKRIDILTKRNAILEERLTALMDRQEELMDTLRANPPKEGAGKTTLAAPVTGWEANLPPKPTPDQFLSKGQTYEDYLEALTDWKIQVKDIQAEAVRTAESRKTEEARAAEIFADHNRRMNEAAERYDDFNEVMAQQIPIPRGVGLAIIELENGPDVAYYLGKNLNICEELMGMSELAAIAEIGALAASLLVSGANGESPSKAPVSSSAPAPIKPGGGASTKSSVPLDETDYQTYRRVRAEQEKSRYRT